MNKHNRLLTLVAALLALFSSVGCSKLRARDQLNKGVTAYKNAKYEEAIDHFQQSVELDPTLINAKMYLATAFAQQYIPGADTPDNNKMADQAIEQYQKVLDMNAVRDQKVNSAKGIAYLYLNMKSSTTPKSITAWRPTWIPTIPSPTTPWVSLTGRPATSLAWKSAPNSASSRMRTSTPKTKTRKRPATN